MSEKIKIAFEAEAGKTYMIKPLGEKLAEPTHPADGPVDYTGTVTGDILGHNDTDFDCGV